MKLAPVYCALLLSSLAVALSACKTAASHGAGVKDDEPDADTSEAATGLSPGAQKDGDANEAIIKFLRMTLPKNESNFAYTISQSFVGVGTAEPNNPGATFGCEISASFDYSSQQKFAVNGLVTAMISGNFRGNRSISMSHDDDHHVQSSAVDGTKSLTVTACARDPRVDFSKPSCINQTLKLSRDADDTVTAVITNPDFSPTDTSPSRGARSFTCSKLKARAAPEVSSFR